MTYQVRKQFEFSASHALTHLPGVHPCSVTHGHNYIVEIVLEAETLAGNQMVVDYHDLKLFGLFVNDSFDHAHLNSMVPFMPTAENLARYLFDWAKAHYPECVAVRVSETPKTWAEYRGG